jgi:hypothetical protein
MKIKVEHADGDDESDQEAEEMKMQIDTNAKSR